MSGLESPDGESPERPGVPRREILKAAVGSAALAGGLAAPWVGNAQTAAGISLKVQSLWPAGNTGQQIFEAWCRSMVERTAGELALVPFAADQKAGVFEKADAVAGGVLDGKLWQPI